MGTPKIFTWRVPRLGFRKIVDPYRRRGTLYVANQASLDNAETRSVTRSADSLWRKAYEPYKDRSILARFIAIKDQRTFVTFINRYGLLHGLVSDVYEDVLLEASQMRRVFALWEQLDTQMDETLAAKVIRTLNVVDMPSPLAGPFRVENLTVPTRSKGEYLVLMQPPGRDSIASIKAEMCGIVTEALRRTSSVALRIEKFQFVLDETSETLIGFLWKMLANQIAQGTAIRLCPCCHKYFHITRSMRLDTVHCSPACSEKMKRWRRKLSSLSEI